MSLNNANEKIRTLAMADPTMRSIFGTGPFRWFLVTQLPAGYAAQGTCLRALRISAQPLTYCQTGPLCIEPVRIQFDVLDVDEQRAGSAMSAVNAFLQGIDLMSDDQFQSPPVTPNQFPSFQLSQRGPVPATMQSLELWVWTTDWRFQNNLLIN